MKRGPLPIWSGCDVCPRLLHVSQQVPFALAIRHGHGIGMDMEEEGRLPNSKFKSIRICLLHFSFETKCLIKFRSLVFWSIF